MEASATSPTEDASEHRYDDGPPPREVRILHEVENTMPEVDCYSHDVSNIEPQHVHN